MLTISDSCRILEASERRVSERFNRVEEDLAYLRVGQGHLTDVVLGFHSKLDAIGDRLDHHLPGTPKPGWATTPLNPKLKEEDAHLTTTKGKPKRRAHRG